VASCAMASRMEHSSLSASRGNISWEPGRPLGARSTPRGPSLQRSVSADALRHLHNDLISKAHNQAQRLGLQGWMTPRGASEAASYSSPRRASKAFVARHAPPPVVASHGASSPGLRDTPRSGRRISFSDGQRNAGTPDRPMYRSRSELLARHMSPESLKEALFEGVDRVAEHFRTAAERNEYLQRARQYERSVTGDQARASLRTSSQRQSLAGASLDCHVAQRHSAGSQRNLDSVRSQLMQTRQDIFRLQQQNNRLRHHSDSLGFDRAHALQGASEQRGDVLVLEGLALQQSDQARQLRRECAADIIQQTREVTRLRDRLQDKQMQLSGYRSREELDEWEPGSSAQKASEVAARQARQHEVNRANTSFRAHLRRSMYHPGR